MSVNLSKGLVGHWPLDEIHYNPATKRHADLSAHCNHGTGAVSAVFDADHMGSLGGACSFDGVSDLISCGNAPELSPTGSFTLAAWVNMVGFTYRGSVYNAICARGLAVSSTGISFYYDSNFKITFNIQTSSISTGVGYPGEWVHVIGVYNDDTNTMKLILNGEIKNETSITSTISGIAPFLISKDSSSVRHSECITEEVRLYNRELNTQERTALYETYHPKFQLSSLQKDLVLDMPLTARWQ